MFHIEHFAQYTPITDRGFFHIFLLEVEDMLSFRSSMLHNEDRELQIRLAELQTDVQIYLTACFGILAGFIALSVGYLQIFYFLPSEEIFLKNIFSILNIIAMASCAYFFYYFMKKLIVARRQITELRKQYIW